MIWDAIFRVEAGNVDIQIGDEILDKSALVPSFSLLQCRRDACPGTLTSHSRHSIFFGF